MTIIDFKQLGEVDLILDGNNYMFRNFDYSGKNSLYTSDGKPVTAVLRTLQKILGLYRLFKVRSITVALDGVEGNKATSRHLLYPAYKGTRSPKPPEIIPQFDYLKECLDAIDIHYIEPPELYEGDDIMATVANNLSNGKRRNIIISSDNDMLQLVGDYTAFLCLNNTGFKLYTQKTHKPDSSIFSIENEFGIPPLLFPEVKGIVGDTSDNIPGVKGIGDKKAYPFIQKYKNLENLYDAITELKETNADLKNTLFTVGIIQKLLDNEQFAFLSRELATINRNIKVNMRNTRGNFTSDKAYMVFKKYEFKDLISSLFTEQNA
jgi:DNA polymerase-1